MRERRGIGIGMPAAPRFSRQAEEVAHLGRTLCEIQVSWDLLRVTVSPVLFAAPEVVITVSKIVYYSIETREIMSSSGMNVKINKSLELIFSSYLSNRKNEPPLRSAISVVFCMAF